ncbi:hypothetical protein [Falsiroseomonas stagni]|uniref:Uncharacterized protein n=1 Tax=Falsiroseomonas stagni DSM 19981 TaxID=1123062 RepID=A0A1I4AQW6_9PROT|nr:hypothetical protein [Falsiroseomonas stagni]SFK58895.1 hypothetical protein SAMN02745775_10492 [Falsiroseomonas stagni DSM 19981]
MSGSSNYAGKDKAELANLRANAERILADPKRSKLHAQARAMLENLPPPPAPTRGGSAAAATATTAAVEQLTALATELAGIFNLSPPEGTSQPHKFTGSDGKPKVGGRQRSKAVAVDRYLSHRRGDAIAAIGFLRRLDEEAETGGAWYVDQQNADTLPSKLEDSFEAARDAFVKRLDAIGTPRKG